ncbi:MAG TPA: hypothetical protein ENF64_02450 [Hadesarchaea archaeon]|nr:hypothetical protein [Hadesarchaea archaeon]
MKLKWPGALAFLAAFLLFLPGVEVVSAQTTDVSISPQTSLVENGQSFVVDVSVVQHTPIAGAQFDLSFDPSLLTVDSVEEGNLFKQGGASTYFQSGTINNTTGSITGVACVILGPNTVESPGTLATIHLTAKGPAGTSPLTLSNVIVGNENGVAVPISVSNGSVHVTISGENIDNEKTGENQDNVGVKLVYDDFNDGKLGTNLGGLSGPMSPDGFYDPVIDFTPSAAEGAYALSLTYDFLPGQWCGYWSYANDPNPEDDVDETLDVSGYSALKFYLKGAEGGEKFKIEVTDSVFDSSSEKSYLATQDHKAQVYVQATASWQEVEIPLSDLTEHTNLDLANLRQINIVFDKSPRSGTIYLDMMRFTVESDEGLENEGEPTQENQRVHGENRANVPPVAYIDFIEHPPTVYENTMVVFSGHGVDPDGAVTGYLWTSSIDGPLSMRPTFDTVSENISLSPGIHQIHFKVRDDEGLWSEEVVEQLVVTSSLAAGPPESSSAGAGGEYLVILLALEAAIAAAAVSFLVVKKFGYLNPAADRIQKSKSGWSLSPVRPAVQGEEVVPPASSGPSSSETFRELEWGVYSPHPPNLESKERLPEIPKEKWSELQMRLKRLMNSRKKF